MFAGLKHLVGSVSLSTKGGIITVEGVPTSVIGNDIKRLWGTGRIEANLFVEVGSYSFAFYEFFALEVHYALSRLVEDRKTKANRRTLSRIIELLEKETWLARRNHSFPSKLNRDALAHMTLTPKPFQDEFLTSYDQMTQQMGMRGGLLAGAAGSGKTFTGLALSAMLSADLVVILCPKPALHEVWEDNLCKDFKDVPSYWLCDDDKPYAGQKYIVANYEFLQKLRALVKALHYKKLVIIVDESHSFNEIKSNRTEYLIEFCLETGSHEILWMSGTPIKALSVEAIPFFRCIDPLFIPEVEAAFKKIFGVSSERATDMLNNRLNFLMFKIEKKELGLLAPIFQEIAVKIPNGHKYTLSEVSKAMRAFTEERLAYYESRHKQDEKAYYDFMDAFARTPVGRKSDLKYYYRCLDTVIKSGGDARFCKDEMVFCNRFETREVMPALADKASRDQFREVKTLVKYPKLKVQGECLGRIVGRMRIDAHIEMADHIDYVSICEASEKKTVVFTSFTQVIEKLEQHLADTGLETLSVYAKTNSRLSEILEEFETDADINPLLATYASLSTAVPLIMADQMILIDAPWRDYQLQQVVARISRIGATTQTYVYQTLLDTGTQPNISSRSLDVLKWSQQQVQQITGITSPYEITDDLEKADLALEAFSLEERADLALESFGLEEVTASKPRFMSWE